MRLTNIIRVAFSAYPGMTRLLYALPKRSAGGTLEPGAKFVSAAWAGRDRLGYPDLMDKKARAAILEMAKLVEPNFDPATMNAAILATAVGDQVATQIIIVRPNPNHTVYFDASTEAEWYEIANREFSRQHYPIKHMHPPMGIVADVCPDDTVCNIEITAPTTSQKWDAVPIAWDHLTEVYPDLQDTEIMGVQNGLVRAMADSDSQHQLLMDTIAIAVADAVSILNPSLRTIRRLGFDPGWVDRFGTPVQEA